jgi:Tfp pilus assembly protein PilX
MTTSGSLRFRLEAGTDPVEAGETVERAAATEAPRTVTRMTYYWASPGRPSVYNQEANWLWSRMMSTRSQRQRTSAALVSVVAILLVVAAFAGVFLSVHTAQVSITETGIHRLRAQAAAMAATHLTLWQLSNDSDLQDAIGRVVSEGDTSFDTDPLFHLTGDLAGATFDVDVWPGVEVVRVRSRGVSGGAYYDRWGEMALGVDLPFGNDEVESSDLNRVAGVQIAMQANLPADGTVLSISAYAKGPPPKQLRYAIYSDAGGEPGSLLVESVAEAVGSNSFHWHTLDIAPTHLPSGTYWLALAFEHLNMYCTLSTPGTEQLRFKDHNAVLEGFLPSWGSSDASRTGQLSIYGTYTGN